MNTKRYTLILILCLTALLRPSPGSAAQVELTVSTQTMASVDGQPSLAVKFVGLDSLVGKRILYAKCIMALTVDSCEELRPSVLVTPLRESMEDSDRLSTPSFDSESADLDKTQSTVVDVQIEEDGMVVLMLTQVIQQAIDSEQSDFALVLSPLEESENCRLNLSASSEKAGQSGGKLIVKFVGGKK